MESMEGSLLSDCDSQWSHCKSLFRYVRHIQVFKKSNCIAILLKMSFLLTSLNMCVAHCFESFSLILPSLMLSGLLCVPFIFKLKQFQFWVFISFWNNCETNRANTPSVLLRVSGHCFSWRVIMFFCRISIWSKWRCVLEYTTWSILSCFSSPSSKYI